jgi:3-hydroxybutyryl-CoA dehydrogenase
MIAYIIGAGTMGAGIAQCFAEAGHQVVIRDLEQQYLARGYATIEKNLSRAVEKNKITAAEQASILGRISLTLALTAAADADIVVEAALENMAVKKQLFGELDQICGPECILASNTSSLSITEIAAATKRPDKVIGMHFFNPVAVMKLVEVIKGMATADATFDSVFALAKELGKEPVAVEESPGFVVNRILVPMINEAIGVLADGVASANDIDTAMRLGANHPLGPLSLADLIGNDVCLAIMETLYAEFGDPKYRPHPLLRKMVKAGYLGRKSGRGFFEYL